MRTPLPVWLFTLSMLLSLSASTVQAQIEQRESSAPSVSIAANRNNGRLPGRMASTDNAIVTTQSNKMATLAPTTMNDTANNVRLIGHIGGVTHAVYVNEHKAYIGAGRRLVILDVSQPATPQLLAKTQALSDAIYDIVVLGNYAYVAAGRAGLQIFDVTNPARPLLVAFFDTAGISQGLFVTGGYVYIAAGDEAAGNVSGLRVINVTNPAAPSEAGFYPTPADSRAVYVAGNFAYLATGDELLSSISRTQARQAK